MSDEKRPPITQGHSKSSALACMAYVTGRTYDDCFASLTADDRRKAYTDGYRTADILRLLPTYGLIDCIGHNYVDDLLIPDSIVYLSGSDCYLAVVSSTMLMNSWTNCPNMLPRPLSGFVDVGSVRTAITHVLSPVRTFPQLVDHYLDNAVPTMPAVVRRICADYCSPSILIDQRIGHFVGRMQQACRDFRTTYDSPSDNLLVYTADVSFVPYSASSSIVQGLQRRSRSKFVSMVNLRRKPNFFFVPDQPMDDALRDFGRYFDGIRTDDLEFYENFDSQTAITFAVRCPVVGAVLEFRLNHKIVN